MLTRLSRIASALPRALARPPARFVSQSKPSGAAGSPTVTELHPAADKGGHEEVSKYVKNPDFHGFSSDPVVDEINVKVGFILGVSVVLVIGGTFIYYLPDYRMQTWARREAEHVIQQREKEGRPLIEENYYDPDKIILPSATEE